MENVYVSSRYNGKPALTLHMLELAVVKGEPINFDIYGHQSRYVPERTCKVEWKHVGGDVAAGYCECGMELDRCHDYEPACLPNYCPRCGVKVVG